MPYDSSFWGAAASPFRSTCSSCSHCTASTDLCDRHFRLYKYDEYQLVKFIIGAKAVPHRRPHLWRPASKFHLCDVLRRDAVLARARRPSHLLLRDAAVHRLNLVDLVHVLWKFDRSTAAAEHARFPAALGPRGGGRLQGHRAAPPRHAPQGMRQSDPVRGWLSSSPPPRAASRACTTRGAIAETADDFFAVATASAAGCAMSLGTTLCAPP